MSMCALVVVPMLGYVLWQFWKAANSSDFQ